MNRSVKLKSHFANTATKTTGEEEANSQKKGGGGELGQSKANFFTYDENKEKENTRKLLLNTGTIPDTLIKEVRNGMENLDPDVLEHAIEKAIRKGDKDKDAWEETTEY